MHDRVPPSSGRYAAWLALGYVALATVYIWLSSRLAADASHTVAELQAIETRKGVIYVVVTGMAVFVGSYLAMRRMERDAAARLALTRALVANDGRDLAGLMAGSVAHDANNVLGVVLGELEELARVPGTPAATLDRLQTETARLLALNRRLVTLTRGGTVRERVPIAVLAAAQEATAALARLPHLRACRFHCHGDAACHTLGSPLLLHQVVSNLVRNAGEATAGAGKVEVVVAGRDGEVVIEVHDDGPGVPVPQRAGLFEALTTSKADGNGLGLFSVKACAAALGGSVAVGDSHLGGACFAVRLPAAS